MKYSFKDCSVLNQRTEVKLTLKDKDQLKELAKQEETTVSEIIRYCIKQHLQEVGAL